MKCAISPCPNDTYLFHAWIDGLVGKDIPIDPIFGDIQQLNEWAKLKTFPLIKLSFHCFAKLTDFYQLLPVGSALGFNCGPKMIAKQHFPLSLLSKKTLAIPGYDTTAHLLLNHLQLKPKEKVFSSYSEVIPLIVAGRVDCGLIIHESRFTFQKSGCVEIADLGELWHTQTQLPLPLGGLAIARQTPSTVKQKVIAILKESLAYAQMHPKRSLPFILAKAQDKQIGVVNQHIHTYVNQDTEHLSAEGISAIETLLGKGLPKDWLYTQTT